MKVYGCPKEIPAPEVYVDNWQELEIKHKISLKAWLIKNGYRGKNTGRILSMPVADGYAQYMLAEGSQSFLVHLPYGDAWQSPDVKFLPKKEVLKRIENDERISELFAKQKT